MNLINKNLSSIEDEIKTDCPFFLISDYYQTVYNFYPTEDDCNMYDPNSSKSRQSIQIQLSSVKAKLNNKPRLNGYNCFAFYGYDVLTSLNKSSFSIANGSDVENVIQDKLSIYDPVDTEIVICITCNAGNIKRRNQIQGIFNLGKCQVPNNNYLPYIVPFSNFNAYLRIFMHNEKRDDCAYVFNHKNSFFVSNIKFTQNNSLLEFLFGSHQNPHAEILTF